jgi:hypothetical protein
MTIIRTLCPARRVVASLRGERRTIFDLRMMTISAKNAVDPAFRFRPLIDPMLTPPIYVMSPAPRAFLTEEWSENGRKPGAMLAGQRKIK